MLRKHLLYSLILLLGLLLPKNTYAQAITSGIAISEPIKADVGSPGDIILLTKNGFTVSSKEYDTSIYGVIADQPVAHLQDTLLEESKLVITKGNVYIKVSNENGDIKEGDFLTSSNKSGVAQRADKSGAIVGVALEDHLPTNRTDVGTILAYVDAGNQFIDSDIQVNLIEALRSGAQAPFLSPVTSLRYIIAAMIVVGSFILGFTTFGKASGTGIEALGRNPMAKRTIQASMIFNFVLTALIMLIGLTLSYFILIL